jgi:hypothetical protein
MALGALPPLLATAWLDVEMTRTILPPYMIPGAFAYPGSEFPDTIGGLSPPDDVAQYGFKMLFGAQGLFAYSPILLFAIVGAGMAIRGRSPLRLEAGLILAGWLVLAAYLITRTGNLGGIAYGERYYLHAIPLLFAFVFFAPPLARGRARLVAAPVFVFLLSLSVISSYEGAHHPWQYSMPPAHPTRDPATGAIGFRWNLRSPIR